MLGLFSAQLIGSKRKTSDIHNVKFVTGSWCARGNKNIATPIMNDPTSSDRGGRRSIAERAQSKTPISRYTCALSSIPGKMLPNASTYPHIRDTKLGGTPRYRHE